MLLAVHPGSAPGAAEADEQPAPETGGADEAPPAPGADNPAEEPAEPPPASTGGAAEGAPKPGQDPGVFVPTEEISEDFAVSFPVDI
jgi:hypothetical protein